MRHHTPMGTLKTMLVELASRTGETPAEALQSAVQEKLDQLDGCVSSYATLDMSEVERTSGCLAEAFESRFNYES